MAPWRSFDRKAKENWSFPLTKGQKRERDKLRQERNQQEIEKEKLRNTFLVKREKWCRDDIRAMHCFNFVSMAVWFGISSTSQREKRRAVNRDPPPPTLFSFSKFDKDECSMDFIYRVRVLVCVCLDFALIGIFIFHFTLVTLPHFLLRATSRLWAGEIEDYWVEGLRENFLLPPPLEWRGSRVDCCLFIRPARKMKDT